MIVIEHFKRIEDAVAPFEETVIYHFKGSIISKLLISKRESFVISKREFGVAIFGCEQRLVLGFI